MERPDKSLEQLFAASRAGDAAAAWRVLEQAPELARVTGPHPIWGGEPTALHVAVENGRADIAGMLLKLGADPNHPSDMYDGWSPLLLAAGRDSKPLVDLLLAHGARSDAWEAAALGDVEQLKIVIAERPDVVREHRANDAPPLHFAATVDAARVLVEHGAPLDAIDKYGSTAARAAAYGRRSRRPVARFLMDLTDERDIWLLVALDDIRGLDALMRDGIDVVKARRNGINPSGGFGETPLHTAAALANFESLRFLLARGADPNASADKGARAMHYAAKIGARQVIDALLEHGANPRLKDDVHNGTPADWARFFGEFELAAYLEEKEER